MKRVLGLASFFLCSMSFANESISDFPPGWQGAIVCSAQNVRGQIFTQTGIYSQPRSAIEVQEQAMAKCSAMSDRRNCLATGCRRA